MKKYLFLSCCIIACLGLPQLATCQTDTFPSYEEIHRQHAEELDPIVERLRDSYREFLKSNAHWSKKTQPKPTIKLKGSVPSHHPLGIQSFRLLQGFGNFMHPIYERRYFNAGVDWAIPEGSDVYAGGAGEVKEIGENPHYGKYLLITHGNGYQTVYAHLSLTVVEVGRWVKAGQLIAYSGKTGNAPKPELRYEVITVAGKDDPLRYCP